MNFHEIDLEQIDKDTLERLVMILNLKQLDITNEKFKEELRLMRERDALERQRYEQEREEAKARYEQEREEAKARYEQEREERNKRHEEERQRYEREREESKARSEAELLRWRAETRKYNMEGLLYPFIAGATIMGAFAALLNYLRP
ncbi:MAG: hypothetical protein Q4B71_00325 [Cardiobacteriaceae bacterium]|nr:hypothetical protein [Cardiobacteriaceae bacterium]